jgi:hypothetical protein
MPPEAERSRPPQAAPTITLDVDSVRQRSDFLRALRRRRRVSRALDELCGVVRVEVDPTGGDYWHDSFMDRGWVERDRAGRALLEVA